jgi:sec-independent protein translocase protein TatC
MLNAIDYFDLFLTIMLSLAIIFQIPPVIFVLSRMGVVSASFLLRNTKYAVLIAFVLAAVITPTADVPNMMIMAGPMILLYIVGVGVAFLFGKRDPK